MTGTRLRAAPLDAVDTVSVLSGTEVVAAKTIRADDPYLEGHYPDLTVYPGVFLVESVIEAVRHLVRETRGPRTAAEPAVLKSVRFTTALRPGDTLGVHCDCLPGEDEGVLTVTAKCTSGDTQAARMTIEFRLVTDAAETGDPCTTTQPSAA